MRSERHARTRFISSKSTLVNFQQGWKKKPQVAMKLPDFCLAPLESSLLSKLLYPPPNPSVGCWDPRAWSVYLSKRPTYACAKNVAILCLFHVVLTWAPLTTFQIALPTTAHTRYKVQFRPHSRAKTPPISWFSRLWRIAFVNSEYWINNSLQNSFFLFSVTSRLYVWFIYRFNIVILPVFSRQN